MAVKRSGGAIVRFSGLSSDKKETTGVPEGSSFRETNTGDIWRFHDGSWKLAEKDDRIVILLTELVEGVQGLREDIEMAT